MIKPNLVKVIKSENVKDEQFYIYSVDRAQAILINKNIYNSFMAIQQLPKGMNHILVDTIALAMYARSLENNHKTFETWQESSLKDNQYPLCKSNIILYKLLDTFHRNLKNLCGEMISNENMDDLILFLQRCPHDFDVTPLLRPHNEFQPVIT